MIGISSSEPPAAPGCCARVGSRDVGKRDRREVRDRLKALLVHLLKWTAQPGLRYAESGPPVGWIPSASTPANRSIKSSNQIAASQIPHEMPICVRAGHGQNVPARLIPLPPALV